MGEDDGRPWLDAVRGRVAAVTGECVADSGVDGGAVALAAAPGRRDTLYASDATARRLEDLQAVLGEGPAVDAQDRATPVLIDDLHARDEGVSHRWPAFLAEVGRLDVRSLYAFPVRVGAVALGTFQLYRRKAGRPDSAQLGRMLTAADAVCGALLDMDRAVADDLWGSSPSARVHQAGGMVMVQLDTSVEEAMVRLRATAYAEGLTLDEVAGSVVEGRRRFEKEEA